MLSVSPHFYRWEMRNKAEIARVMEEQDLTEILSCYG